MEMEEEIGEGGALAERLRAGLAAGGLTQAELARRAGLTRAYVGRLLAGSQAAPTVEVVRALAAALALDPAERLRLYAAAGLTPPELAAVLGRPPIAALLIRLAGAEAAERRRLEGLLTRLLALADDASAGRLVELLATAPEPRRAHLRALLTALLELLDQSAA